MTVPENLLWAAGDIPAMLAAVAAESRLGASQPGFHADVHGHSSKGDELLLRSAAAQMGIDLCETPVRHSELPAQLRYGTPCVIGLRMGNGTRKYLAVARTTWRSVHLVPPEGSCRKVRSEDVRAWLFDSLEDLSRARFESILSEARFSDRTRRHVERRLLTHALADSEIGSCWQLRPRETTNLWTEFSLAHLPYLGGAFIGAYAVQHLAWVGSWWTLGYLFFRGHLEPAWLTMWILLLATRTLTLPFASWMQSVFVVVFSSVMKRRLMRGTLQLEPGFARSLGGAGVLTKVLESGAFENLALAGGLNALMTVVEIAAALIVLIASPSAAVHVPLLLAWLGVASVLALRYHRSRKRWVRARLGFLRYETEQIAGHATVLIQQATEKPLGRADLLLAAVTGEARIFDASAVGLSLVPHGWFVLASAGLLGVFGTDGVSAQQVAVSVGGVVLAYQALSRFSSSFSALSGALIAWDEVAVLNEAAGKSTENPPSGAVVPRASTTSARPLVVATGLHYRHSGRNRPAVSDFTLTIEKGDGILLVGDSGSGKSTAVGLITGFRQPSAGVVLYNGLDRSVLGHEGIRRVVAGAPQSHENYIFSGSLAFNLLMARRWPPSPTDLQDARSVCEELGLGPLLDRMPDGLNQIVGETGWKLSQGERTRLFIARAVLVSAPVTVLDESLGGLDPEALQQVLACLESRCDTILVAAHV